MRSADPARQPRQVLCQSAVLAVPMLLLGSPGGMQSLQGVAARLQIKGSAGLTYQATALPPGMAISAAGLITGAGRTPGTRTVTGTSASGAGATSTFVCTVSPAPGS